jgi:hypothetical protein
MGACMHIACHADVARVRVDSASAYKCAQTAQTNVISIYTAEGADVTVRRGFITTGTLRRDAKEEIRCAQKMT